MIRNNSDCSKLRFYSYSKISLLTLPASPLPYTPTQQGAAMAESPVATSPLCLSGLKASALNH